MANITQSCRSLEPKHPRARLFISEVAKAVILAIRLFCLSVSCVVCSFERDKCGTSWHSKIFRATQRNNERGGGVAKVE